MRVATGPELVLRLVSSCFLGRPPFFPFLRAANVFFSDLINPPNFPRSDCVSFDSNTTGTLGFSEEIRNRRVIFATLFAMMFMFHFYGLFTKKGGCPPVKAEIGLDSARTISLVGNANHTLISLLIQLDC